MAISELGKRVWLLRREREIPMTQATLASLIGVTPNTIARLERGVMQDLKALTVSKMADVFDVPMDYLIGRSPKPTCSCHKAIEVDR